MTGPITDQYGFSADEVNQYARDLCQLLTDLEVPLPLMLLSLCRALTIVATDEELDLAAHMLDELREDPLDDFADLLDGIDDAGEEAEDENYEP